MITMRVTMGCHYVCHYGVSLWGVTMDVTMGVTMGVTIGVTMGVTIDCHYLLLLLHHYCGSLFVVTIVTIGVTIASLLIRIWNQGAEPFRSLDFLRLKRMTFEIANVIAILGSKVKMT